MMKKIIVEDRAVGRKIHIMRLDLAVQGIFQLANGLSDLQANDIALRLKLVERRLELLVQLHAASEVERLIIDGNLGVS